MARTIPWIRIGCATPAQIHRLARLGYSRREAQRLSIDEARMIIGRYMACPSLRQYQCLVRRGFSGDEIIALNRQQAQQLISSRRRGSLSLNTGASRINIPRDTDI